MLSQRIATAVVLAPAAIALVVLAPPLHFATIAGAICLGCMWEWSRLAGLRATGSRIAFAAGGALIMAALWWLRDLGALTAALGLALLWWGAVTVHLMRGGAPSGHWLAAGGFLASGYLVIVPGWAAVAMLKAAGDLGFAWVLALFGIIWAADVAAYFTGRWLGHAKLAPVISPGKTWAGAYGGLAAGAAIAAVAGWVIGLAPKAVAAMVLLGGVTVVLSIVGDLYESLVKRRAGVKDSGHLLPGHGGLLDRLDSLFAAGPVFALGRNMLGG